MKRRYFFGRQTPEINATSTADMAFILLVFFLMSTSIDKLKGVERHLAPASETEEVLPLQVKERNVLTIHIDSEGRVFCREREVQLDTLKDYVKHFILNREDDPGLPEVLIQEDPVLGEVRRLDRHVLLLQCTRTTPYKYYFVVQHRLMQAYAELREMYAREYLHRSWQQCTVDEQEAIRVCCPQRIAEAELTDEKGGVVL